MLYTRTLVTFLLILHPLRLYPITVISLGLKIQNTNCNLNLSGAAGYIRVYKCTRYRVGPLQEGGEKVSFFVATEEGFQVTPRRERGSHAWAVSWERLRRWSVGLRPDTGLLPVERRRDGE